MRRNSLRRALEILAVAPVSLLSPLVFMLLADNLACFASELCYQSPGLFFGGLLFLLMSAYGLLCLWASLCLSAEALRRRRWLARPLVLGLGCGIAVALMMVCYGLSGIGSVSVEKVLLRLLLSLPPLVVALCRWPEVWRAAFAARSVAASTDVA